MRVASSNPPQIIDVIIRFHDCRMLPELDRALFSLYHQSYESVRPIVVTQGLTNTDFERVKNLANSYNWQRHGFDVIVHNVDNRGNRDLRSKLLNVGISLASGRFLCFLDCDDYMYGHAYEWLVHSLNSHAAGIAFGGIAVKHVRELGTCQYTFSKDLGCYAHPHRSWHDLLDENFCPIHSFLVDRCVVDAKYLVFNERICRLEDYAFILEICSRYPSVFSSMEKIVGAYIWKSDGTNSSITGNEDQGVMIEKSEPWEFARQHISSIKQDIRKRLAQSDRAV